MESKWKNQNPRMQDLCYLLLKKMSIQGTTLLKMMDQAIWLYGSSYLLFLTKFLIQYPYVASAEAHLMTNKWLN